MIVPAELYEALDRGTLDSITLPWYGFGAYRIYEVAKYATPLFLGSLGCEMIGNKDAWSALPDEFRKYHLEWKKNVHKLYEVEYNKGNEKWLPIFKKTIEFHDFPGSERQKILARAGEIYDAWVEDKEKKGLPGREIMDYFLKKRKEIAGK